jgi:F-type H+-transporting ATPase subunit a
MITNKFKREIAYSLGKPTKGIEAILILIFITILLLNLTALYPQNFSTTAHLPITLPLSLTVWLTIITFGWTKNTNHMLSHLLPQGTPVALINFIVIIELVRNLIRPITLCVRLTANLIAGHLLISLLGNAIMSLQISYVLISILAPLVLTILEGAVACIQAYVFITLITLYTTEIK